VRDHVFACPVNSRGGREDRCRAAADPSIPLRPKHCWETSVRSVLANWSPTPCRRGTPLVEAATSAADLARMGDGQHAAAGQGEGGEPLPGPSALRYTEATWAEDRATRGRDPSADPGAKTGAGGRMPPLPISGIGHKAINPWKVFVILDEQWEHGRFPRSRPSVETVISMVPRMDVYCTIE
jgi:hypothetical protein